MEYAGRHPQLGAESTGGRGFPGNPGHLVLTAARGPGFTRPSAAKALSTEGGSLPEGSVLTQGWRAEHILPELRAVLDGRRSVRVADVSAAAPFAYGE